MTELEQGRPGFKSTLGHESHWMTLGQLVLLNSTSSEEDNKIDGELSYFTLSSL